VRYADDAVLVFETERDARGVLAVLPKRFGKYSLRLHPEKTRTLPTLQLLCGALQQSVPEASDGRRAYQYSQFCDLYRDWTGWTPSHLRELCRACPG